MPGLQWEPVTQGRSRLPTASLPSSSSPVEGQPGLRLDWGLQGCLGSRLLSTQEPGAVSCSVSPARASGPQPVGGGAGGGQPRPVTTQSQLPGASDSATHYPQDLRVPPDEGDSKGGYDNVVQVCG